jgi:hypothetical protein
VIKGAAKTERLIELTVDGNGVAKGEELGGFSHARLGRGFLRRPDQ